MLFAPGSMHYALSTMHYALCSMLYALGTMPNAVVSQTRPGQAGDNALCTMLYALCTIHYAPWTMLFALGSMHYALSTMHYALCSMLYALGTMLNAVASQTRPGQGRGKGSRLCTLRSMLYALCTMPYVPCSGPPAAVGAAERGRSQAGPNPKAHQPLHPPGGGDDGYASGPLFGQHHTLGVLEGSVHALHLRTSTKTMRILPTGITYSNGCCSALSKTRESAQRRVSPRDSAVVAHHSGIHISFTSENKVSHFITRAFLPSTEARVCAYALRDYESILGGTPTDRRSDRSSHES